MDKTTNDYEKLITEAKAKLTKETNQAIDSVDLPSVILGIKEKRNYTLEQLDDLEIETELLLCGLTNPTDYPKELESRMGIPRTEVDSLINDLNELVFKKIRNYLMTHSTEQETANPITEITNIPNKLNITTIPTNENKKDTEILNNAGIEIMPEEIKAPLINKEKAGGEVLEQRNDMLSKVENPDLIKNQTITKIIPPSISSQKLAGTFSLPKITTDHSLPSLGKTMPTNDAMKMKTDPYREIPE